MNEISIQTRITREFIGGNSSTGQNILADDLLHLLAHAPTDHVGFHFAAALQDSHDGGFRSIHSDIMHALTPALMHVSRLATDEGFIDFNLAIRANQAWPHWAQTNAPSASAVIGMNSLPATQYGHRTTRSVIAATPLAVGTKTNHKGRASKRHPRTARVARMVGMTLSLLASNE
jgi:hypothetical protein